MAQVKNGRKKEIKKVRLIGLFLTVTLLSFVPDLGTAGNTEVARVLLLIALVVR